MTRLQTSSARLASLLLLGTLSCSEDSGNRGPTGGALTGSGGRSSGGATSSGGTSNAGGSKASGGTGGGVASGGTSSSSGGTGGSTNSGGAAGSVMCSSGATTPDLTNCDAVKVAAFFKAGNKCNGCHFSANLHQFDTEAGLNAVVGMPSTKVANMNCQTTTLVAPGNAEGSLLYLKLNGTPPDGCGAQMPKKEGARAQCTLTADELKCVADWINGLPATGAGGQGGAAN